MTLRRYSLLIGVYLFGLAHNALTEKCYCLPIWQDVVVQHVRHEGRGLIENMQDLGRVSTSANHEPYFHCHLHVVQSPQPLTLSNNCDPTCYNRVAALHPPLDNRHLHQS